MMHLIKLEFKKKLFTGYVWGSLLAYVGIVSVSLLFYFSSMIGPGESPFHSYSSMLTLVDTLVCATFVIYASVLISRLIINEFRDKTIGLLFAYPVNRKKLIFAKLSIVFSWTFINIILANLLVDALLIGVNHVVGEVSGTLTTSLLTQHAIYVLTQAVGAAGMSLLSLVLGLRKNSVVATVVSSIFIVAIVVSNNDGFSLSSITAVPLTLAALGIFFTYLSFRNIDRVDVS
ncbi:ABC transporter permease [Kroppenstedtia sanguinis]|uniref:ABC transporter permease n=1 Tax=Kroppenstedtia sanguinis TaxID=1380684 RepID=A0ABW4CCF8_9BACL